MIEVEHDRPNGILIVRASGVLTVHDYKVAVPEVEYAMELAGHPLRLLLRLEDFRGWEVKALWQELKFDLRHMNDPGRIAVVGDTVLEEWVTRLAAPFAKAEMRFYRFEQENDARRWLCSAAVA
jgi:hypothetical protein